MRIPNNRSAAAENSGQISGTVQHSQYECAVVEPLEDDQVISVCANPYRLAQVWTRHVVMRSVGDLLAVLPHLTNERDGAPRIDRFCQPPSARNSCISPANFSQAGSRDSSAWLALSRATNRAFGILAASRRP